MLQVDDKINVLVTGVGGGSVGHQILHALLLQEDKYQITAVDADRYSFGLYQVTDRCVVPLASDEQYMPAIIALVRDRKIQVVLAGTEAEMQVLGAQRAALQDEGCLLIGNPQGVIDLCGNKYKLAEWLSENGFITPDTVQGGDWRSLVSRKGFPIVGKPCSNSSGSRNVVILNSDEEVERYLAGFNSAEIIFQEYCGCADEEYTVGVCLDGDSRVIDTLVLQRRLSGITLGAKRVIGEQSYALSTGYSQGFVVENEVVQGACERLVKALGMQGPANIQCRVAEGKVFVFEVHPRFSGTTSLRADVGFNEPDILLRTFLKGERVERQAYRRGVAVIRAFQSVVVPLEEMDGVQRITP